MAVVRNCIRLNGATRYLVCCLDYFDSITLTKVDVLDELEEIKVGVGYIDEKGEKTDYFPRIF